MKMSPAEKARAQAALTEVMNEFDRNRALWIKKFGTDEGFGAWFGQQVGTELAAMMRKSAGFVNMAEVAGK